MQRLLLALALLLSPALAEDDAPYVVGPLPAWVDGAPMSADPEDMLQDTELLPTEAGDPVQVLLLESTWTLGDDGVPVTRYRMIYRVLVRDPGYWAQGTASWRPWQEERPNLEARVISRDGRAWSLDPRTISEVSDDSRAGAAASGERRLVAPLPGLGVGSVVEVVTERRQTQPPLPGVLAADYVFGLRNTRVAHERLILDVPAASPLRFTPSGLEGEPSEVRAEGRRRVTWSLDAQEKGGPPLELVPSELNTLKAVSWATQPDWTSGAQSAHALVEASLKDADVAALAETLTAGADTPELQLDALIQGVRARVRPLFRNLTDDVLAPQTPAETLKLGTGDALDQATLLVALCRASGLEAEVALLIGGGPGVDPEQPEPQRLDHALVRVAGEPPVWVDVMEPGHAAGVLPWWIEGRLAVMARAEGPALERLPVVPSDANTDHVEVTYDMEGRLNASMRYREYGLGRADAAERAGLAGLGDAAWAERQQLWARYELGVIGETEGGYLPTTTLLEPLVLDLKAEASRHVRLSEETLHVQLPSVPIARLNAVREQLSQGVDEEREVDVQLAPERTLAEVSVRLPPGFGEAELPEDVTLELGPLRFHQRVSVEGGALRAELLFDTGDGRLTAEQAREAAERLRRIVGESKLGRFTLRSPAGEALEEDRLGEALRATRALAEAHPDSAVVALRHARLLERARLRDLAVAELERALALDPELFEAWVLLAGQRLRDRWGRKGLGEWDLAAAHAAAERALALRPDDPDALGQLLEVLFTTKAGYYLGPGLPLSPTLERIEALREAHPEDEAFPLEAAARSLMLYAGRLDELAALPPIYDGTALAAVAITEGPAAAVAALDELPDALRRRVRDKLVLALISTRSFQEAAAVHHATRDPDDERYPWLLAAQRVEDMDRPRSDEDRALRLLLPALLRGDTPDDAVVVSPEVRAAIEAQLYRTSGWARVPPRALADVIASVAAVEGEGKARRGRVVRIDLSAIGVDAPWVWVLQRKGRAVHVIAATAEQRAALADAALADGDRAYALALISPWLESRRASIPELPSDLRQRYEDLYALVDPARAEEPGWLEAVIGRALEWEDLDDARSLELAEQAIAAGLSDVELMRYRWYAAKDLGERVEETGRDFADALPEAKLVDKIKVLASSGLREEAEAAIAERWSNPDAPDLLRLRSWIAELDGDIDLHVSALTQLAEAYEAEEAELTVLAWASLFMPELPEDALEYVERAQATRGFRSPYLERVRACIHLARGEEDEAAEVLDRHLRGEREDIDEGWRLVQAGLAYSWGLPDLADALLEGVRANEDHFTRYELAQRWLEAGTARMATPWLEEASE